ncbi:MAG: hypothetical protein K0R26_1573 [Bacteroidota bacterium]|jgi:hypothetical protein|nr:hypothetical protein [Bacteroidota bacterium]
MEHQRPHTFHIPVMGLAYTIDTPLKVAPYGIDSVVSIIEDHLIEQMREVICNNESLAYHRIDLSEPDFRARRITAYLNLLSSVVAKKVKALKAEDFDRGLNIRQYFEMLPDNSALRKMYHLMLVSEGETRLEYENILRNKITAGRIDVNIMTKLDKINYDHDGNELPVEYSDALSALRGFAHSDLDSSIVFSAGLNPRLFSYCESFTDFFPDSTGYIKKKIILKVSDYRSALIQGKYLAKKGLWISEFRIESGINCGGHAFISNGIPMGPILEEFKLKRNELYEQLFTECKDGLHQAGRLPFLYEPDIKISAQGGIGTSEENDFLRDYYQLDATGWGSPFLLVPEATNVDRDTLEKLIAARKEDYYLSHASPLGVPFSNLRTSSSEEQRKNRITKGRPGSPCYKGFLSMDKEFTAKPICTASREYQKMKIDQLKSTIQSQERLDYEIARVTEKDCLCEGLGASALLKNNAKLSHKLSAVTICPGPNLAYFTGTFSLKQMVDHIYGRLDILNGLIRPNIFINELHLYIDYLKKELEDKFIELNTKKISHFELFKSNLLKGIEYYEGLFLKMKYGGMRHNFEIQLKELRRSLDILPIPKQPFLQS